MNRSVVSSTWVYKSRRLNSQMPSPLWSTGVHLNLSILLGLATKQVDYAGAFVQSEIDTFVYVEISKTLLKGNGSQLRKSWRRTVQEGFLIRKLNIMTTITANKVLPHCAILRKVECYLDYQLQMTLAERSMIPVPMNCFCCAKKVLCARHFDSICTFFLSLLGCTVCQKSINASRCSCLELYACVIWSFSGPG